MKYSMHNGNVMFVPVVHVLSFVLAVCFSQRTSAFTIWTIRFVESLLPYYIFY